MDFFADWHTHSKHSDGYGTIEENVLAAASKGLCELAIADHGPACIGAGVDSPYTFLKIKEEIDELNKHYRDITVKTAAEANIISVNGDIDLPHSIIKNLDILIVGLHPYVVASSLKGYWSLVGLNQAAKVSRAINKRVATSNTKALKEAVYKYDIDFISHPNLKMPVNIPELAFSCAACGTAIEINTGHHYNKNHLIKEASKTGVDFVVSSDAHYPETVGELHEGGYLLEKFNIPPERVLNAVSPLAPRK